MLVARLVHAASVELVTIAELLVAAGHLNEDLPFDLDLFDVLLLLWELWLDKLFAKCCVLFPLLLDFTLPFLLDDLSQHVVAPCIETCPEEDHHQEWIGDIGALSSRSEKGAFLNLLVD